MRVEFNKEQVQNLREQIEQLQRENERLKQAAETEAQLADEFKRELEEARKDAERLRTAGKAALHEMRHTTAPRGTFTDAVDALDSAINAAREKQ